MFKMKDYNKNRLHKWTTVYEAMKIHLRRALPHWVRHALWLYKSYSAMDRPGHKTVSAPAVLTHTAVGASPPPAQTPRGCAEPPPGSDTRNCPHRADLTHLTPLVSAGFSYLGTSEMLLGWTLEPQVWRGWVEGTQRRASHGEARWGGAAGTQSWDSAGSSELFQQLWDGGISRFWAPGGLQTPTQQRGRQWQILY